MKRLIFSINAGRSGSKYLATILNKISFVDATHEPEPSFASKLRFSLKSQNKQFVKEFWKNEKLPLINKFYNNDIYIETSHIFCLGFLETFLEINENPFDIIILLRDIRKIALSFYQMNRIPFRSEKMLRHSLCPTDKTITNLTLDLSKIHDYQLCYWYVLEVFKIAEKYQDEEFSKTIWLDDIKNKDKFELFLNQLNLNVDESFWFEWKDLKNKKINNKNKMKIQFISDNIDALENEVIENLELDNNFLKKFKIR